MHDKVTMTTNVIVLGRGGTKWLFFVVKFLSFNFEYFIYILFVLLSKLKFFVRASNEDANNKKAIMEQQFEKFITISAEIDTNLVCFLLYFLYYFIVLR